MRGRTLLTTGPLLSRQLPQLLGLQQAGTTLEPIQRAVKSPTHRARILLPHLPRLRHLSTMRAETTSSGIGETGRVVGERAQVLQHLEQAIEKLTPLALADHSWDNVGLLAEAPFVRRVPAVHGQQTIHCCIDLTEKVMDEVLADPTAVAIVTYHPPIFTGLKSLTMSNPIQSNILRAIANGLSIYCIHTAADNSRNGVNDFIADVTMGACVNKNGSGNKDGGSEQSKVIVPLVKAINEFELPSTVSSSQQGAGAGRIVTFPNESVRLEDLVEALKTGLDLEHVQVSRSPFARPFVGSVAICAGSGSSVLKGVKADVWVTGELGHHEVLAARASGTHVILTNHSSSERPWLRRNFQHDLQRAMNNIAAEADLPVRYRAKASEADVEPLQWA